MAYTHNPSTQEEEAGGWAGGHPELHSKFKESPDNQILPHLQKFIKDLFVFMCIHFFLHGYVYTICMPEHQTPQI